MGEANVKNPLESLVVHLGGDRSKDFKFTKNGEILGDFEMTSLVTALVRCVSL